MLLAAVQARLKNGLSFGAPTEIEIDLCSILCALNGGGSKAETKSVVQIEHGGESCTEAGIGNCRVCGERPVEE